VRVGLDVWKIAARYVQADLVACCEEVARWSVVDRHFADLARLHWLRFLETLSELGANLPVRDDESVAVGVHVDELCRKVGIGRVPVHLRSAINQCILRSLGRVGRWRGGP
jgi:hypothetical protein